MIALLGDGPEGSARRSGTREEEDPEATGRRPFAGMRTRVLLSFLILLTVSTAASVLVLREVLLSRIDDAVAEELTEEIEELQELSAEGLNPRTGEPFRGVEELFDAYLGSHSAAADSAKVAFAGDEPYAEQTADRDLRPLAASLLELGPVDEPTSGDVQTSMGRARYVAVPVSVGGASGSLTIGQLLVDRRETVEDAVRIAIGVSIVMLLLASLFIWLAAGRAMAPLQALATTLAPLCGPTLVS